MASTTELRERRSRLMDREAEVLRGAAQGLTPEQRGELERIDQELSDIDRRMNVPKNDPDGSPRRATMDREGEVRTFTYRQKISDSRDYDLPVRREDLSFGRWLAGMVTGNWEGKPAERALQRALGESIGTAGGFMVPEFLSDQVIDLARAQARVFQAGALTFQMRSERERIAKVTGDPGASWVSENATIPESTTMTFGSLDYRARNLASLLTVSRQLLADANNAGDAITNAVAAQMALSLDSAALRGNGAGESPLGVYNTTGVTLSTSVTGGSTTWTNFVNAITTIQTANYPGAIDELSVIWAPRTAGTFRGLTDTTNQPVRAPADVELLRKFVTTQVPTGGSAGVGASTAYGSTSHTEIYIAPWQYALFGIRQGIEIEASPIASDGSGNGFSKHQVLIKATLRADFGLTQPTFFNVVVGTTA